VPKLPGESLARPNAPVTHSMNGTQTQLLGPSSPIRGLANAVDGASIGAGFWQDFTNVRTPNGVYAEVRGGTEEIYAAPSVTNGVFKGGMVHPDMGAWAAIYDPAATKVKIYQNTGGGWTERTDSSTRLATNAKVVFDVVQAPQTAPIAPFTATTRYVVAQNGTDTPLVMADSATVMSKHTAIAVGDYSAYRAIVTYADYYQFGTTDSGRAIVNTLTATNSTGARFGFTIEDASTLQQYAKLSIATTATFDDTADIENSIDRIDWSTAKQMHLLYDVTSTLSNEADIWNQLKLIAIDGSGNSSTLYDPTSSSYPRPIIVENGYGKYLAAFTIPTTVSSHSYKTLRFQWKGTTLTDTVELGLYGVLATTGDIDGASSFAVSHLDTASFVESPSVVCITETSLNGQLYGCPMRDGMNIPVVTGVGYQWQIWDPVTSGSATELRMIYIAPPGSDQFYYVSSSGTLGSRTSVTSNITYPLTAPGGMHQCMPAGPVMKALGSRLLVGGGSLKDVWFSSLSAPFRFRPVLEYIDGAPDIQGAGTIRLQGETVQAFEPMAGVFAGAESVLIWTNLNLYRVDGSDSFQLSRPRRLGAFGTLSPGSIASHNGVVFWLDAERQVRSFASSFENLSILLVDSVLATIPDARIGDCSGAVWRDAYYLAYTPSGGSTNTDVLVWDMRGSLWAAYTAPTGTAAALGAAAFSGRRKLYVWTSSGRLLEYDKPGTSELGSTISVTLQTRDLTINHWEPVVIRRIGVVCSTDDGALTLTRPTRDNQASPTESEIALSATVARESGGGLVWRYDSASDVNAANLKDWGPSVRITGAVSPGWKLLSVVAEIDTVEGGADV